MMKEWTPKGEERILLLFPEEGSGSSLQVVQSYLLRSGHTAELSLFQCCMQHLTCLDQYLVGRDITNTPVTSVPLI